MTSPDDARYDIIKLSNYTHYSTLCVMMQKIVIERRARPCLAWYGTVRPTEPNGTRNGGTRNTVYLFCSVLKFGPVPTSPTPLLQDAPGRLSPPLDQWYGVYYCSPRDPSLPAFVCCVSSNFVSQKAHTPSNRYALRRAAPHPLNRNGLGAIWITRYKSKTSRSQ